MHQRRWDFVIETFIDFIDNDVNFSLAEDIEEECIDNEQCKPLLASCVENKCSCGDKQHFINGHCETKKGTLKFFLDIVKCFNKSNSFPIMNKGLNEVCSTATECVVEKGAENVECRNSVCQCKFGYRSDAEQRSCVATNKKSKWFSK